MLQCLALLYIYHHFTKMINVQSSPITIEITIAKKHLNGAI